MGTPPPKHALESPQSERKLQSGRAEGIRARPQRHGAVAISGVNSFLGSNLVGLLEEDESVGRLVALDLRAPRTAGPKTRFYALDLTQPAVESRLAEILEAERVETFVHLALLTNPTHAAPWAHELESVGTMRVLNACAERRMSKFVLRSSTLVYGAHPGNPNFLCEDQGTRGLADSQFVRDKIDVEQQVRRFAATRPNCTVTLLRFAHLLGPSVDNYVSRWLSRRVVVTALGFDPLLQFVHEADALAALRLALATDVAGTYNVVSDGVLPVSTVLKLAGRRHIPLPAGLLRQALSWLWAAQLTDAPPSFVSCLRFMCVADGERARAELGFIPRFSARDAVLDFGGSLRLRRARLVQGASA